MSNGKHVRWWLKVFASDINNLKVVHRPGRENLGADALSRNPVTDTFNKMDIETVESNINSLQQTDITTLLYTPPSVNITESDFHLEQRKDPKLKELIDYRIRGNIRGIKLSRCTKQTGFSRLYFRGSLIPSFRGFRVC